MKKANSGMNPQNPVKLSNRKLLCFIIGESLVLLIFLVFYFIMKNRSDHEIKKLKTEVGILNNQDNALTQIRSNDQDLVKPLRLIDVREANSLSGMKQDISELIDMMKKEGRVSSAAVYFRYLNEGRWFSVNNEETFRPGSINKIPLLIYFLKLSESDPAVLNTKYPYDHVIASIKKETYQESRLKLGQSYSVKELLEEMITSSDNKATIMLLKHLDKPDLYKKIFTDLNMPVPQPGSFDFALTAADCSKFMRVLYSSTYLSEKNSEYALKLLSKSTFQDGLKKPLPSKVIVAHKFGESGFQETPEFSETGIVYNDKHSYLLTVMTKGTNSKEQAEAISEISKLIYDKVTE